jgi:hypothetical protein
LRQRSHRDLWLLPQQSRVRRRPLLSRPDPSHRQSLLRGRRRRRRDPQPRRLRQRSAKWSTASKSAVNSFAKAVLRRTKKPLSLVLANAKVGQEK